MGSASGACAAPRKAAGCRRADKRMREAGRDDELRAPKTSPPRGGDSEGRSAVAILGGGRRREARWRVRRARRETCRIELAGAGPVRGFHQIERSLDAAFEGGRRIGTLQQSVQERRREHIARAGRAQHELRRAHPPAPLAVAGERRDEAVSIIDPGDDGDAGARRQQAFENRARLAICQAGQATGLEQGPLRSRPRPLRQHRGRCRHRP